jgi:hypothetical protein
MISKDELESRLQAGESLRSIAKSLGMTHQNLCWHRDHWGMPRLREGRHYVRKVTPTGRFTDQWGYVMIRTSNKAGALAYTPEHVLIAEEKIGRKLMLNEVVHHINGIKSDNRPENLFIGNRKEHMTIHKDLESLAMELVNQGTITFDGTTYHWA